MSKIKHLGPFKYYWGPKKQFISAWLAGYENASFGWEWGQDNTEDHALIHIQVLRLVFLHISHDEYVILGFWWHT